MFLVGLFLVSIGVFGHLYFGVKYRKYFVVDKHSLQRSSWSMIKGLRSEHPLAANIYIGVYFVLIIGVILLAADHLKML